MYCFVAVLLQHGADPSIRNTDGKTPLDLADTYARSVLTGHCALSLGGAMFAALLTFILSPQLKK